MTRINRDEHRHVYEHLLAELHHRLIRGFNSAYDLEATQGTFNLMLEMKNNNGENISHDEAVLLTVSFVLAAALGVEATTQPWAKKMRENVPPTSNA